MVLDPTAETIQVNVTFSGLGTPATAAHIHCCLAFTFQSVNVGVATTVPAYLGFPLGGTSGDYHSAVLSLLDPATYSTTPNTGFLAMFGGDVSLAAAALISGRDLPSVNDTSRSSGLITARIVVLTTRV